MSIELDTDNLGTVTTIRPNRPLFWVYCKRVVGAAQSRSRRAGVPCRLDIHFLDRLFVDQGWRCAISNIPFEPPGGNDKYWRHPFGPSLDRIVPELGYIPGNVRFVCNIVNFAMGEWGAETFMKLVDAIKRDRAQAGNGRRG